MKRINGFIDLEMPLQKNIEELLKYKIVVLFLLYRKN